ncbi:MAG: DUF4440 domain-containing protein [Pseudomonadota bacterium]
MKKVALALLLSLATATAATAQALPSVALPADLERVLRDYEKAWVANDPAALARLFTADGMALPSGQLPALGPDNIRKAYSTGAGSPLLLRAIAYGGSGDLAYVIGGFGGAPDKPDFGKFVLVLRKVEGRWLIVADMDNSNAPRRPAPPPAPSVKPQ